jgi:phosphonate transport system substrate-binding protein
LRRLFAILLLALLSACGSGSGDTASVLRFTAIPDQNTTELQRKFDPVADYLAEALGVAVQYVPSRDYQASVDMFKNGDIHLAWFGGLTGVQARNAVEGAVAIAQGESDPEFFSYFIAHRDAGLGPSDEFPLGIRDKRFTFGSRSSTSGRLMPEFFLMEAGGLSAMEFFTTLPSFSGSHDKTAELVESGQFQAGVLNYKVYDRRVAEGKTDPEVCRVIYRTPTFADYNLTAHPDIDRLFGEGTIARLADAMISMNDPALLAAFDRKELIPASNEDFEGIRQVALKLEMLR